MAEKTNITKDIPPEAIAANIERTREEMTGTVSEIQERLSAQHARDRIRESTVDRVKSAASKISERANQTSSSVMSTVRSNQVPIALMSLGIGWLLYNRSRDGHSQSSALSERGSQIKEKTGELTEKAQAKAGELSGQFREKSSEFASKAKYSASRFGRTAQERARGAGSRFQHMIQTNPFGMLLAAFAVGSAFGFSIPESRKEKELMGTASGSLLEKAKETAQKTMQKAQHAAEKAVQTAEEEFKQAKSA